MVNGKTVAIVALVAIVVAVGAVLYTSLSYDETAIYPGSKMIPSYEQDLLREFLVNVSYPEDRIYEGTVFKVRVIDLHSREPVKGANVSFMIPLIHLNTTKEGIVFFTAPFIQDKYLLHPQDTSRAFFLTVTKEGYYRYAELVDVHLAP